jgi:nicotinamide riboside kinase
MRGTVISSVNTPVTGPITIALLGAESTGKTQLSLDLAARFRAQGLTVAVVPEVLREWCDAAGRTPRVYEQVTIAQSQAQRVHAAIASGAGDCYHVVLADTTPLMTAVYSETVFQDRSLYDFALSHQRLYRHTLLTGLDLPWVADGFQRDSPGVQGSVDALVRQALGRAGIGFQVVYGQGEARADHALTALQWGRKGLEKSNYLIANFDTDNADMAVFDQRKFVTASNWVWPCDKCSDSGCEHRLFTQFQARDQARGVT